MSNEEQNKPLQQPLVSGSLLIEVKKFLEQYRDEERARLEHTISL